MSGLVAFFEGLSLIQAGVLASLVAGLATGLGALPVFVVRRASQRTMDVLLGGAAGVMFGATAFSLVLPATEVAGEQYGSALFGALVVAAGLLLGAAGLLGIHQLVPHEHFVKGPESQGDVASAGDRLVQGRVRRIWLFVSAITLHNFPEGLAVGVGFGTGDVASGLVITTAIFLQNLPEGFAVALALVSIGYSASRAAGFALATGLVETVGGFVGAGVVALSAAMLPWALAAAAGAMLFVISHEVIPETHRNGHETAATFGVIAGFALMVVLDLAIIG